VGWTVTNQGAPVWSGTQYWNDYVFISPDPIMDGRAVLVAAVPHSNSGGLASGASYRANTSVKLPAGVSGTYYVYVTSDRFGLLNVSPASPQAFPFWTQYYATTTWELNKVDNVASTSLNVVYREPDLVVGNVSIASPVVSGATVPITFTVTNTGTRATRVSNWTDGVYMSVDGS